MARLHIVKRLKECLPGRWCLFLVSGRLMLILFQQNPYQFWRRVWERERYSRHQAGSPDPSETSVTSAAVRIHDNGSIDDGKAPQRPPARPGTLASHTDNTGPAVGEGAPRLNPHHWTVGRPSSPVIAYACMLTTISDLPTHQ